MLNSLVGIPFMRMEVREEVRQPRIQEIHLFPKLICSIIEKSYSQFNESKALLKSTLKRRSLLFTTLDHARISLIIRGPSRMLRSATRARLPVCVRYDICVELPNCLSVFLFVIDPKRLVTVDPDRNELLEGSRDFGSYSIWKESWIAMKGVMKVKTFQIIVLQGLVGSLPWTAMVFFTLWFQLIGEHVLITKKLQHFLAYLGRGVLWVHSWVES
ncbi:hypothetical protein LXL04_007117 [Taraxacum kok-saghyz]